MKGKRRLWLWLVVVTAVAIGTLIVSVPRLVETIVRSELAGVGITELTLGENYWGLSGAGTTALNIVGSHEQWDYRIRLHQLQANYSMGALLNGEVTSLGIESAVVTISGGNSPSSASSELDLDKIFSDLAALALPVETVRLKDLLLQIELPEQVIAIKSSRLIIDSTLKSISGKFTASLNPRTADGLPSLRIEAKAGELNWIPDLTLDGIGEESPLVHAEFRLTRQHKRERKRFPFALNLSLATRDKGLQQLSAYVPDVSVKTMLAQLTGDFTVTGKLALPGKLELTTTDWYDDLPLTLSVGTDIGTAIDKYGVESLRVSGQVRASGSASVMKISLPDDLHIETEILGKQAGLPEDITDSDGRLGIEGKLELDQPVLLKKGEFENILLRSDLRLKRPVKVLRQLTVSGSLEVNRTPESLKLSATEPLAISGETTGYLQQRIAGITGWPENAFARLALVTNSNPSLEMNAGEGSLSFTTPLDVRLTSGTDKTGMKAIGNIRLASLRYLRGNSAFSLESNLNLPVGGKTLPAIKVNGTGSQEESHWQIATEAAVPAWSMSSRADWVVTGQPGISVEGELLAEDLPALAQALDNVDLLPAGLSLATGQAHLHYRGAFGGEGERSVKFGFQLEDLSGIGQGVAFEGGQVSGGFAVNRSWSSYQPIEIRFGQLSSGVTLNDVRAEVILQPSDDLAHSRWLIDKAAAAIFGGNLSLKSPSLIQLPELGNSLTFRLSNVQLEKVLSLYSDQGISGYGILNGEIPLLIEKDGVHVDHGNIRAETPGGKIAFDRADAMALAKTNQQLAMTLGLLENFNYEVLNVGADLLPTGDLTLAVSLEGNNPDQFDGRRVNFNINFQDNIFQLFRVLKLTDELTKKIEGRLDKQSLH